jgi:hypothetical protein
MPAGAHRSGVQLRQVCARGPGGYFREDQTDWEDDLCGGVRDDADRGEGRGGSGRVRAGGEMHPPGVEGGLADAVGCAEAATVWPEALQRSMRSRQKGSGIVARRVVPGIGEGPS